MLYKYSRVWLLSSVLIKICSGEADRLLMDIPASSKRCIGEQFPDDSLGKWTFKVQGGEGKAENKESKVRVTIKDPNKKLLYSEALTYESAIFPFTTKTPGLHKACLQNHHRKSQRVELTVTQGFSVKEYGNLVDENMGPIVKQLDDSKSMLREIANEMDLSFMREQEERKAAAETEQRIVKMGYVSMLVLIGLALWQVFYLRSFFRAKKLL
mmetsp:Transcript_4097/g.5743  ORF Transcript_4097/g.5743 Transcript_4097/m.5743 type:complete len:212 (+) Transcript_4097:38-673(+)